MPLTGQPSWSTGDVPTLTQLNTWLGTTVTNKFAAALGTADFAWPLEVNGDIDMAGNAIEGIPFFDGAYSLEERPQWMTADQLFKLVESRGGGAVCLPGNTTQGASTNKDGRAMITVGSNLVYYGHGFSSVSAGLYAKDKHTILVQDMQINSASWFENVDGLVFQNCSFTLGSGTYKVLLIGCKNVAFENCHFDGATSYHVQINKYIAGCYFDTCDFEDHANSAIGGWASPKESKAISVYNCTGVVASPGALTAMLNFDSSQNAGSAENRQANINIIGNSFDDPGTVVCAGINWRICYNYLKGSSGGTSPVLYASIRPAAVGNLQFGDLDGTITGNIIHDAPDIGAKVGETAYFSRELSVVGNIFDGTDEGLVIVTSYVSLDDNRKIPGNQVTVFGNVAWTDDGTLTACALWELVTDITPKNIGMAFTGNFFEAAAVTPGARGFHCYLASPGSAGGRIGSASGAQANWVYVGNHSPGTTTTDAASSDMFDNSTNLSAVASNNT